MGSVRTYHQSDLAPREYFHPAFPSLYPLGAGQEQNKSNAGLAIGILADDSLLSLLDL